MAELTLTLYSSSFCGACSATRHVLQRVTDLVPGRVTVTEVNVADAPDETEASGITSTPTVVLTSPDGREISRASGVPTVDQVLTAVAKALV